MEIGAIGDRRELPNFSTSNGYFTVGKVNQWNSRDDKWRIREHWFKRELKGGQISVRTSKHCYQRLAFILESYQNIGKQRAHTLSIKMLYLWRLFWPNWHLQWPGSAREQYSYHWKVSRNMPKKETSIHVTHLWRWVSATSSIGKSKKYLKACFVKSINMQSFSLYPNLYPAS
jgi:hypothetical protein